MDTTASPPHVCSVCGASYIRSLSLASHMKVMHSRRAAATRRRLQAVKGGVAGIPAKVGVAEEAAMALLVDSENPLGIDGGIGTGGTTANASEDSNPVCNLNEEPENRNNSAEGAGAAHTTDRAEYGDLARRVQLHFRRQNETSSPLYDLSSADIEKHRSRLSSLSRSETQLIDRCRRKGLSAAEARDELIHFRDVRRTILAEVKAPGRFVSREETIACEKELPKGLHSTESWLSTLTGDAFGRFILQDRKVYAVESNWRRCDIALADQKGLFPHMDRLSIYTGAFRPAIDVVSEVIEKAGGFSSIPQFEAQYVFCSEEVCDCVESSLNCYASTADDVQSEEPAAKRRLHQVRSSWRDGAAFEEMTQNVPCDSSGNPRGKIVPVGLYEDGIAMAASGACSISVLRLWIVSNSDPTARKWVTVGVFPQVEDRTNTVIKDTVARARREVYQRFVFLVIEGLAQASRIGHAIPGGMIFPRIYNIPVDQPASMSLLSHKRTNCDRECGQCDLHTRDDPGNVRSFAASKARVQEIMSDISDLKASLGKEQAIGRKCKAKLRKLKLATIRVKRQSTSNRIPLSSRPTESDVLVAQSAEDDASAEMIAAQENIDSACKLVDAEQKRLNAAQKEAEEAALVRSGGHADMLKSEGNQIDYRRGTHLQLQVADVEMKIAAILQRHDTGRSCEQDGLQKAFLQQRLKSLKGDLNSMSLNSNPSALVAVDGMVTLEGRMHKIAGYDNLHVSAEGTDREVCDGIPQIVSDPKWSMKEVSKLATIRAINAALEQLPGPASLPRAARIRETATELQSGQTATLRQRLTAVLAVVLLGLRPQSEPDDDLLVQVALRMAENDRQMRSVNEPPAHCLRTKKQIDPLQSSYLEMARDMTTLLGVRPKTKLHHVAFHIHGSLEQFGTFRDTDTGENERQNKDPRRTWHVTNRKKLDIAPSVVSIMLSKERQNLEEREIYEAFDVKLATERCVGDTASSEIRSNDSDSLSTRYSTSIPQRVFAAERLSAQLVSEQNNIICQIEGSLSRTDCIEQGLHGALADSPYTTSPPEKPWIQLKSMSQLVIAARFEWAPTSPVSQTLYLRPFNDESGISERPGVAYKKTPSTSQEAAPTCFGILVAVIRARGDHGASEKRCHDVAVVMRLETAEAAPGNIRMVREYGHRRLRHALSLSGEPIVDMVSAQVIMRELAIVPDLHAARKEWGMDFTLAQALRSTGSTRTAMHYFDIKTVQFTSAPTRTVLCGLNNSCKLVTDEPEESVDLIGPHADILNLLSDDDEE